MSERPTLGRIVHVQVGAGPAWRAAVVVVVDPGGFTAYVWPIPADDLTYRQFVRVRVGEPHGNGWRWPPRDEPVAAPASDPAAPSPAAPAPAASPDGAALIAAERARQVAELDYDAAHDDQHHTGLLAAVAAGLAVSHDRDTYICRTLNRGEVEVGPDFDNWGLQERYGIDGDEPNRLRALVIAGALLAAEIDRLQRAAARANAAEVAAAARAATGDPAHA